MRLYLDANTIIHSIEGEARLRQLTLTWISNAYRDDRGEIVTSRLSRLETRSKPIREANRAALALYDNFFRRASLVEVTADIIELATELRARYALGSADSVHAASAVRAEPSVLLTTDGKLARVSELKVVVLE